MTTRTPRGPAPSGDAARAALASLDRPTRTKIIATLARRFGDLDLAEDALQDAFAQALRTWPETGLPRQPAAWLTTTAAHRALDVIRRDAVLAQKLGSLVAEEARAPTPVVAADPADVVAHPEDDGVPDDRLGLFFACAHPVLAPEDRIALTLRFVGGLSTVDVAQALLIPVSTMQQRIVRAKKRIRSLGVRFTVPRREDLAERRAGVQRVISLMYAEGFARSSGDVHIRDDLTTEALRLARVLHELTPGSAESTGLLALLLLTEARRPARADDEGRPVPLAEQDRSRWRAALIAEGTALAEQAAAAPGAGSYAIQAAIAAVHAEAGAFADTDWRQIAVLYRMLAAYEPGPMVRLGEAVARGRAAGLAEGIRLLDALAGDPALDRLRAFHVARAVTLDELGEHRAAADAYRRALRLPGNDAEGDYLQGLLAAAVS
ncbi:DUF6596 domain-containing protein [Microbacterium sp. G2-8]|uniref:RNA polymerase sigma factor n=1 Tax=Microbacterium sp. G2-8 TaxID=2842454 RepID=UPI0027E3910C|nr:DUF6596 domain-containing protein [Microbacterium sp. G2-8]